MRPPRPRALLGSLALLVVLTPLVGVALARPATAQEAAATSTAQAATGDPATELAERWAPIVAVKPHPTVCGEGEPFSPTSVEAVLGRDDVTLHGPGGEAITAPTAADLFGRGEGWYLDMPGNPLSPGCDYDRWWADMAAENPPTVYARVLQDPDEPGTVVVQYWFWWIFNDWNDKHEGDWEMVQLLFDADSVEQALAVEPRQVVFAQHEGAQYVDWGDGALVLDGQRVVTHPGTGSHADYPQAKLWFGKSASTGFGCDDSRAATNRIEPAVVLLPSTTDEITGADDPFAWLTFTGRWGQKAPSFNNGPQGPATKPAWEAPSQWVDDVGRAASVAVPPLGSRVTDFFCGASAQGSLLFVKALDEPLLVGVGALLVIGAIAALILSTGWRPAASRPIGIERRAGQIFTASFRLQAEQWRAFGALGLVVFAGGVVAALGQSIVLDLVFRGDITSDADESSALAVPLAILAGAIVTVPVAAIVRTASVALVHELARHRRPTFRAALHGALKPPSGTYAALLLQLVATIGSVVHLFAPIALWLVARWAIATPEAVDEHLPVRQALRRSSVLTRHHRWRTLGISGVANVVVTFVGPLIGTVVLLATDAGFGLVNLVSGLIGIVLVPWAGIVIALLREDLLCRHRRADPAAEPVEATTEA